MERTLVLVKPDGVQRGLVGTVLQRLEQRGLKIIGMKMLQPDAEMVRKHYHEHTEKPFFGGLMSLFTSGPVVAVAIEGPKAIQTVRDMMGATDPLKAAPGTIRGDYAVSLDRNVIHGSANETDASYELNLWFTVAELVEYGRANDSWILG